MKDPNYFYDERGIFPPIPKKEAITAAIFFFVLMLASAILSGLVYAY